MTTVGLIGYGSFGELVAQILDGRATVKVTSRTLSKVPERLRASMAEVAACDDVVISVPLGSYRTVLTELAQHITPDTVVVDVCSVKQIPCRLITELLPNNKLVATHPLFGPQTTTDGLEGLVMVVCDEESDAEEARNLSEFAESLGLEVVHMSAEEHDREMAKIHALTFFIARGLFGMDIEDFRLKTPSYKRLESLIELERNHSEELFETIQLGNPFAESVRRGFVRDIDKLACEIEKASKRKEF